MWWTEPKDQPVDRGAVRRIHSRIPSPAGAGRHRQDQEWSTPAASMEASRPSRVPPVKASR